MSTTKTLKDWANLPILNVFPNTYLAIASERGLQPREALNRAGLEQERLADPAGVIGVMEYERLINVILDAVGDKGIGIEVGWRLPPTAYGNFGYALLCSATIEQALQVCQRFWHLIAKGIHFNHETQGDTCVVELTFMQEPPPSFRKLSLESSLVSIFRGFQLLAGSEQSASEIWFDFEKPEYWNEVSLPLCEVKHGMPVSQYRYDKNLLQRHAVMSNPTGFQFAIEQCERELSLLDSKASQVLNRVKKEMVFSVTGYPDLVELGKRLNMTPRTLRRRLDEEGNKYSTILEQARRRDAIRLLDNHDMEIQKIAELLGYADPANFTRAFRQWTGQTPSQYRLTRRSD